jgi:hypothetical protein
MSATPVVDDARAHAEATGDLRDADEILGAVTRRHSRTLRNGCDRNLLRRIVRTCMVATAHDRAHSKSGPGGAGTPRGPDSNPVGGADVSKVVPSPDVATTYRGSVVKVRDSILEHSDLVFGLAGLRDLGPNAEEAVSRALEIPQLAVLRLSWELIDAVIESEDEDPAILFTAVLGERICQRARYAVFGEPY